MSHRLNSPAGAEEFDIHAGSDQEDENEFNELVREAGVSAIVSPNPANATLDDYREVSSGYFYINYRLNSTLTVLQAFQQAERNNLKLRSLVRDLQLKVSSLEVQLQGTRRSRKSVPKKVAEHVSEITHSGRKYCTFVSPWVEVERITTNTFNSRPNIDPLSPSRYETQAAQVQGAIAELMDWVPETLYPATKFEAFSSTVSYLQVPSMWPVTHTSCAISF